jgi:small multidrug resistance pump
VVATIGILWFQEAITVWKALSLLLIIVGVVGLNLGGETVHQG